MGAFRVVQTSSASLTPPASSRASRSSRSTATARLSSRMAGSPCWLHSGSSSRRSSTPSSLAMAVPPLIRSPLPAWLWVVMIGGIGFAESQRISIGWQELDQGDKASSALKPGYYPGDLGFDPLNLKPEDPAELALMQEKELSHCRLAMIAAAGFLAQEAVSKQTWGAWWGDASF